MVCIALILVTDSLAAFQFLCPADHLGFDEKLAVQLKWMVPIFLFNERDKIQSPTVALNSQDGHSVSNTNKNFGNRVRSTSKDARFQANNRWVSQPSIDEPDYRNSNARLPEIKCFRILIQASIFKIGIQIMNKNRRHFYRPTLKMMTEIQVRVSFPTNDENDYRNSGIRVAENAAPPASSANSPFQDHNLRHDGNRRESFPTNDENDYRNSGVRLPGNAPPPASSANSHFQDHNLRHDGNRRESFPTNNENDYRNSGVRLPGNAAPPASSANSHFQDHNLRHDGNRRESFPTNNENDYRNSGVRLPGNAAPPASSANSHFQDHNLRHDGNRRESFPTNNENDYRNSGVRLPGNAPPPASSANSHFQDHNLRHDGNRRESFPTNNENDYRNSGVRLPENAAPPASSANSQFQSHNSKYDGNRWSSLPTNDELEHRNSDVRLPENRIRTNSDTGREFQIYNSRSDSGRRAHLPVNDEPDLRYPEAKLPNSGTITPSSNTGAHFQAPDSRIGNDKWTTLPDFEERDYGNRVRLPKNRESPNFSRGTQLRNHNARSNNLSPNLQSKEASTSHSPTNQGRSLQRRLQNPSRNTSRFQYTLPLPPIQYSTENSPVTKQDIPVSESNYFNQYDNRYPNEDNFEVRRRNSSRTTQRRRKSRKLKILVKKLPNQGRNDENGSLPQTNIQSDSGMKIPKKLLNELKTNLIRKLSANGKSDVELEIQFQDHVWNIPFVNNQSSVDISPVACTRAGLFQHPKDCNMFYECFWDKWLKRFTLHVFSCPVRLIYDENIRGCTRPSFESPCQNSV
ncbi:uncharacterized protein TNCT_169861 [Trichonephila clavata]|uniref:Chitin-binding type-2 domain-containing protein n=1 Tax=Trichonephila clavata TaxID=2740835 RepID=A0A8X6FG38_TRICU|nr:uncharacterized protein TNCT_169861 [Trichonephila clavata]